MAWVYDCCYQFWSNGHAGFSEKGSAIDTIFVLNYMDIYNFQAVFEYLRYLNLKASDTMHQNKPSKHLFLFEGRERGGEGFLLISPLEKQVRVILRYHHTSAPHLGKWGLY
jgi:hypothetical protein